MFFEINQLHQLQRWASGPPAHSIETLHQVHAVVSQLFNLFLASHSIIQGAHLKTNARHALNCTPTLHFHCCCVSKTLLCPACSSGRWLTNLPSSLLVLRILTSGPFFFFCFLCRVKKRKSRIQSAGFAPFKRQRWLIYEVILFRCNLSEAFEIL